MPKLHSAVKILNTETVFMMNSAALSVDPTLMILSFLVFGVSQIVAIVYFVKAIKCIKLYREVRRNIQDRRYWIADATVLLSVPEDERTLISFEYDGKQYQREFDLLITEDDLKEEVLKVVFISPNSSYVTIVNRSIHIKLIRKPLIIACLFFFLGWMQLLGILTLFNYACEHQVPTD